MSGFGSTLDSQSVINSVNCDGLAWICLDTSLFARITTDTESQEKAQELIDFAHENNLISIAPGISDAGSLATIWPMNIHHIYGDYVGSPADNLDFDFSDVAF
jgi:EAL domain-containing protein (putative c-di-GMP-specific phosphodiesterase class I)